MSFSYNLADNQKAERKLLVTAVNTGGANPVWTVIGAGVEDSSIEYNADTETVRDILGITETDVKGTEPQQDFEPMTIRGGNPLQEMLEDIMERNALSELSQFDVLIIKAYKESINDGATVYYAEKHTGCTIIPTAIGGSGHVDMPIEIHYSNNKVQGFVNAYKHSDNITFTAGEPDGHR